MPLEPFTLVGATTKVGLLGGPFRDRFGHSPVILWAKQTAEFGLLHLWYPLFLRPRRIRRRLSLLIGQYGVSQSAQQRSYE